MATLVSNQLIDQKLPIINRIPGKIPLLIKRLLLATLILTLSRLVFILANWSVFHIASFSDFLYMIWGGFRFDMTLVLRTQWLIVLIHLWPGDYKYTFNAERLIFILYLILNGLLLGLNLVDSEYFDFTHKRSTFDMFLLAGVGNDIVNMIPMFVGSFWYLALIWMTFMILLIWLYPKDRNIVIPKRAKKTARLLERIITFLIIGILAMIGKGKIDGFLNMGDAVKFTQRIENIPIVLNTPFCIMESAGGESMASNSMNHTNNDFYKSFSNKQFYAQDQVRTSNVVVIILESFSAEYSAHLSGLEKGYTPFLDSLMQEGLYFTNAFANGKKSIEAVPSIMCGVPALMTNPVITSDYSGNHFTSIGSILKDFGYHTSFYHGAANGSMGFEQFTLQNGFDIYKGMNQYPYNDGFDGNWGIEDERFLQFFARDLDSIQEPFMTGIFTISSHHPYTIPERYKDTFPEGPIPMLRTIAYADHSLRMFFKEAQKHDWYKNTLFVLTADHTGKSYTAEFGNTLQNYRIPLVFYAPGDSTLKGQQERVAQQIDILPSVIDYLGLEIELVSQGNSVFKNNESFAVNYLNNVYQFIEGEYLLQYDGKQPVGFYNYQIDRQLEFNLLNLVNTARKPMIQKLNAIIQDYSLRMENDNWEVKENIPAVFYTFNEIY